MDGATLHVGSDQENRAVLEVLGHSLEEPQGVGIAVVQVVEHEHQWGLGCYALQVGAHRGKETVARLVGGELARARGSGGKMLERGDEGRDVARARARHPARGGEAETLDGARDHFGPGPVGRRAFVVVAPAPEHVGAALLGARRCLAGQAGLARAVVPADHDHGAATLTGGLAELAQPGELRLPPDKQRSR